MSDPLSVVAGVTGVLAFTAKLTQEVITLITTIKDAPRDIADLQFDLKSLSSLVLSAHNVSVRYPLRSEDKPLEDTVRECLEQCQTVIQTIKQRLSMFQGKGKEKGIVRRGMWYLRKPTIRDERDRLRDSKAMVELSITVLNAHLMGKGQQEIIDEMSRGYEKLSRQFRDNNHARRLRRRLHDDLESVSGFGGPPRQSSFSATTEASLPMKKFLQAPDDGDMNDNDDSITIVSSRDFERPMASAKTPMTLPTDVSPVLIQATQAGNTQQVSALLSMGVSPSTRNPDGRTALHFCALHDDVTTATILINSGANIDALDEKLRTPFRVALSNESFGLAALLLRKNCAAFSPSTTDGAPSILPALFEVIRFGDSASRLPSFSELLSALRERLDSTSSKDGVFLVHEAIDRNDDTSLRILLFPGGFDPNRRDAHRVSPIHHAILLGRHALVRILIDNRADPNDFLPSNPTKKMLNPRKYPWHQLLWDQFNDDGANPLISAARKMNDPQMVGLLLEKGADPNFKVPPGGGNVLGGVCAAHHLPAAKLLIDHGADPNHMDSSGISPMYWAVVLGNEGLLRYMLEKGRGNVNIVYESKQWQLPKWSLLHLAANNGHAGVVSLLLEKGTDVTIKDAQGRTAWDLARGSIRGLIEEKLKEQGVL
ncbi:ankyrin repeat-containing domain protein [Podospora australis]|uniref:Ankyrin repeat-containing domain protein n=1 Tax=Podospora australis TaxID=1536484 RepID=A0AAN6WRS1_9PEZI|nr:ankyrin repeat-containing domain protein [Podospora australis]